MPVCTLRLEEVVYTVPSTDGPRSLLDLSCTFTRGAIAVVTGSNGAGKSTLLHLLGGILRPTEGTLFADDDPVSRWRAGHRDRWRRRVGLCFQRLHLLDDLSAIENVALPLIPRGRSLSVIEKASRDALTALGVAEHAGTPVSRLSGGERQRIALARAMVTDPDILLLDEPTAHQDDAGVGRIAEVLHAVRETTITVITGHDDRLLASGMDRILALTGGALREIGG